MEIIGIKLAVDSRAKWRRSVGVDDADELVIHLCTQLGMIMEDTSIVALTIGGLSDSERAGEIAKLRVAAEKVCRLIEAARILSRLRHLAPVSFASPSDANRTRQLQI
jgi:hypothetical protein